MTNDWLSDFFTSYYQRRPVNATFIGVHDHDHRLPDFSEQGIADTCAEMQRLIATCPDAAGLAEPARMDRALALGFLEIQLAEFRSQHFQSGNPTLYTGEAIFGLIALFLRDFAPMPQRIEAAIARLHDVPRLLAQGQAHVRAAPREWTQKALRECTGALNFCRDGLKKLQDSDARLLAAAERAAQAFADFQRYLSEELLQHPRETYACGAEFFDLLMRRGHWLDMDGEQVAAYGERRFGELKAQLEREARNLRADGDVAKILASASDQHPSAGNYLAAFHQCWSECRQLSERQRLVSWPDYPLRYAPVPELFREAAPYLYFLPYRAPAPFDTFSTYDYWVPPLNVAEPNTTLRAVNDSVIKLNHVVHHGSIGHHVQNYRAYRAASRVGQIAAVDCASRIAMFCGGTMAEGWACYVTDVMGEVGFYTPLEAFAQLHSQLRQAARCVVDAKLHLGKFSFAQAVAFYRDQVGMTPDAAQAEAVKNSMFPGAAMMYLVGTDAIHKLRAELMAREGEAFSLQKFHDQFLSYGSVPVALIARQMLNEKGGGQEI